MKKVLLIIFSTAATIAVLEIFARIYLYIQPVQTFPRKDYDWITKTVRLNTWGYWDKEIEKQKPPNVYRIYVLGDSYTFGWMLSAQNERYSDILQTELTKEYPKSFEVVNAAQPGFSIGDSVDRMAKEGILFSPDLVIIGLNIEDLNIANRWAKSPYIPKIVRGSALFRFVGRPFIDELAYRKNEKILKSIFTDTNSPDWQKIEDVFLRLKKSTDSIGSKLAILYFPSIDPKRPNRTEPFEIARKKINNFSEKNQIRFIDPSDSFDKYQKKQELVLNPIDAHPTGKAHELVVAEILKNINFKEVKPNTYTPPVAYQTVPLIIGSTFPQFSKILSLTSSNPSQKWVAFETKHSPDVLQVTLVGPDRKVPSFADILETGQSFTHGSLVGGTLFYHANISDDGRIIVPLELYGHPIYGISRVDGFYQTSDGQPAKDILTPASIQRESKNITIKLTPTKNYSYFVALLSTGIHQIDITKQNTIQNLTFVQNLTSQVGQDQKKISIASSSRISDTPTFMDSTGIRYPYVFVNGKLEKVKTMNNNGNVLEIELFEAIKDTLLEVPVRLEYIPAKNEFLQIAFIE